MWVINSAKTILSSEINLRLVTKYFTEIMGKKKVLMEKKVLMKSLHEVFVYVWSETLKWFGLVTGEI